MPSCRRTTVLLLAALLAGTPALTGTAAATPPPAAPAPTWSNDQLPAGDWSASGGTYAATGDGGVVRSDGSWTLVVSPRVAATADSVWQGTFASSALTAAHDVRPYLLFHDAAGVELERVAGQMQQGSVGTWTEAVPAVALAPVGTAHVSLGVLFWDTDRGDWHGLRDAGLARSTSSRQPVVGPLRTAGSTLYDANGPLVLRGLHRFGLETHSRASEVGLTRHEIARMRAWGATVVRVSLSQSFWLPGCHQDPGYPDVVAGAVDAITSHGMVALLDLHTSHLGACGPIRPQQMADTRSVDFWQQVAARFQDNPLVAFDLFNEPHDISDEVWLNGGQVTTPTSISREGELTTRTTWTAAGMQQLYEAVRGTSAQNVVVVSGNDWANALPAERVDGTGVVYGVHAYTCPTSTGGHDCTDDPSDPAPLLDPWVAAGQTVPVAITEFGWPSGSDATYVRNVVDYADRHGWGWVGFAWDGSTHGRFNVLADTHRTYQPSPTGMALLAGLQR